MVIKFEFYELFNMIGMCKKCYYVCVVNWQCINIDYLVWEIQYGFLFIVVDIKVIIILFSEKLVYYLKDGVWVYIEGIGYFYILFICFEIWILSFICVNKVKFKLVIFCVDKYLKYQLSDVKIECLKYKLYFMLVIKESIDEVLMEYFLINSVLICWKFELLCGLI